MSATTAATHPPAAESTRAVIALLDRYADALYHGDVTRLREVFHPLARYATMAGAAPLVLDLEPYLARVGARATPASLGDAHGYTLDSLTFAGDTAAVVRLRSTMLGFDFEDLITLARVDNDWLIVAKVFHFVPTRTTTTPEH
jgi:Putative lumazine-binding